MIGAVRFAKLRADVTPLTRRVRISGPLDAATVRMPTSDAALFCGLAGAAMRYRPNPSAPRIAKPSATFHHELGRLTGADGLSGCGSAGSGGRTGFKIADIWSIYFSAFNCV